VLPVHYTGKIAPMNELRDICCHHDLVLIEDAAQAFGARYHGAPAGSFGRLACFSMNPMKVFAAAGEAGCVVTDDTQLYERLLALRYNGTVNKETCLQPGLNARLDTLQAAVLLARRPHLDEIIRRRREIAGWYNDLLAGCVHTPREREYEFDVYYTYTIQADRRDELRDVLTGCGIETKIQHPILMPQQPAYRGYSRADVTNAEKLITRILCLPAHEKMSRVDVETVAAAVRRFYEGNG